MQCDAMQRGEPTRAHDDSSDDEELDARDGGNGNKPM